MYFWSLKTLGTWENAIVHVSLSSINQIQSFNFSLSSLFHVGIGDIQGTCELQECHKNVCRHSQPPPPQGVKLLTNCNWIVGLM